MATIIAKKDLICDENVQRFTKGKKYEVLYIRNEGLFEITEYTQVLNNQFLIHRLGNWAKHFKIKKK